MREIDPYKRFFIILALSFVPFIVVRFALLITYFDDFNELNYTQIFFAFIHGFRFDASIISLYIGLPLLLTLLPFGWARTKIWQGVCLWTTFTFILFLTFILIADFIYFGFVRRHIGAEVHLITEDVSLMLDMAITDHGIGLAIFTIATFVFAKMWKPFTHKPIKSEYSPIARYSLIAIIFVSFVIVGRGGLQYKPVRAADAFSSGSAAQGYLVLNGAFSTTHAMRGTAPKNVQFMTDDEALTILKKNVVSKKEKLVDDRWPLLRASENGEKNKPNIVFLMIESFDAIHFDFQRKLNQLPPLGSTPVLDDIAENGIVFTKFFASGQRSMDGLAATLASVPTLPGQPYIGKGLEQNRLSYLGTLAKSQSYETYFLQTSNRGSFRIDSIAAQAGFENYYGAEDIPAAHHNMDKPSEWGVWDHDTLQFAADKFDKAKEPFIGYVFTSTTHNPWRVPDKKWEKHPTNSDRNKYLNSLSYLDWTVGEFIKKSRASSYFNNTIFIITGDHISRFAVDANNLETRFHIPLIIYSPSRLTAKIENNIGNQLDLIPTIIELADWNVEHASMGRSLFDDKKTRFSFSVTGDVINYIDNDQWVSHNLSNRVFQRKLSTQANIENAERKLLGFYQAANKLIIDNRLAR